MPPISANWPGPEPALPHEPTNAPAGDTRRTRVASPTYASPDAANATAAGRRNAPPAPHEPRKAPSFVKVLTSELFESTTAISPSGATARPAAWGPRPPGEAAEKAVGTEPEAPVPGRARTATAMSIGAQYRGWGR